MFSRRKERIQMKREPYGDQVRKLKKRKIL